MFNTEQEFLENEEVKTLLTEVSDLFKVTTINVASFMAGYAGVADEINPRLQKLAELFSDINPDALSEDGTGVASKSFMGAFMANTNTAKLLNGLVQYQKAIEDNIANMDECSLIQ